MDLAGAGSVAEVRVTAADGATVTSAATDTTGEGWRAAVELPVGGPYDIADDQGEAIARDLLVGDLWILAGQSNMAGYARMREVEPPSPAVHVLDMARRWRPAVEPLHRMSESPDPIHHGLTPEDQALYRAFDEAGEIGAGLGIAFGARYHRELGVPVGLIATAHGGTSMAQWSPSLAADGGNSLYGSLLLSVAAAGGRVAGVLWYQGESDADPSMPFTFADDLEGLVEALRRDLADPRLPFLHVQLGRYVADAAHAEELRWSQVREAQRCAVATGMASAIDLDLDDPIHISTGSLRRLGNRLARLASGRAETLRVRSISVEPDSMHITVAYDGVTGTLSPRTHVAGFSLHDAGGLPRRAVVHAEVTAEGNTVRLLLARPVLPDDYLAYAFGVDPHVSLRDSADMSAPAFGPLPLLR